MNNENNNLINPISFVTKEPNISLETFYNEADNIIIDREKNTIEMSRKDEYGCTTMILRRIDGLKSLEINQSNIDDFDTHELSELVKKLLDEKKTQSEVAKILGKSQSYISKLSKY